MAKATVSTSLPTDLLARVDKMVDENEVSDRSAAIERALTTEWNINDYNEVQ